MLARQVAQHLDARGADRDVGRALPPRAAERVADDHADLTACACAQLVTQLRSRSVRVVRKQDERARLGGVRGVDARRRADEPVLGLADDERRAHAHDPSRLAEDHLDAARRVAVGGGDLARPLGGLDPLQPRDSSLDLRDRLLRDDDDVAVLELRTLDDHRREVVVLVQLGDALEREDRDAVHRPVTLTPA